MHGAIPTQHSMAYYLTSHDKGTVLKIKAVHFVRILHIINFIFKPLPVSKNRTIQIYKQIMELRNG